MNNNNNNNNDAIVNNEKDVKSSLQQTAANRSSSPRLRHLSNNNNINNNSGLNGPGLTLIHRPPPLMFVNSSKISPEKVSFKHSQLKTIRVIDSDNDNARRRYHSLEVQRTNYVSDLKARQGPNLFLEALLLLLCRQRCGDVETQENLFNFIRHHFQQMNILLPQDASRTIATMRDQCCLTVDRLIKDYSFFVGLPSKTKQSNSMVLVRDSYLERLIVDCPVLSILRDWSPYSIFCAPRYRSEFEQIEQLGKGGYGRVYKVQSKMDKCEYAIKKINLSSRDPKCFSNVQREVEVFAHLKHPNIVDYVTSWLESSLNSDDFDASSRSNTCSSCATEDSDSVSIDPRQRSSPRNDAENVSVNREIGNSLAKCNLNEPNRNLDKLSRILPNVDENDHRKKSKGFLATLYIQMELCSRTLTVWIEERNTSVLSSRDRFAVVNEEDSDHIFFQILLGVQYIHSEHLMHRDLNPNNIFINENLCVKIGDFGLARQESLIDSPPSPLTVTPVKITSAVGTQMYSAPEQLDGSYYDQKADIYSLGIIKFELFFPFGTIMEKHKVLKKLRDFNGYIEEMDIMKNRFLNQVEIIQSLLNQEASRRPSASELVIRILAVTGTEDPVTDLNKTVTDLKQELKKKVSQIKHLKYKLKVSNYKNMKLKRKVKSLEAKD